MRRSFPCGSPRRYHAPSAAVGPQSPTPADRSAPSNGHPCEAVSGQAKLQLPADRDLPKLPRFSLQLRIHRPGRIKSVPYDGEEPVSGETHGFVITEDAAGHIVRINVDRMLTKGHHHAAVHYDIEW